jgi:hypothetical protein
MLFGANGPDSRGDPPVIPGLELIRHIGTGGDGDVWLARQQRPIQRLVAIKCFRLRADGLAIVERYRAERDALARLPSAGFCAIFDAGITADGRPFLVTEYIDGPDFAGACLVADAAQLLHLFCRLARNLDEAHRAGIVHLDIKPGNVLVAGWPDGSCEPRIIDFGLARPAGAVSLPAGTVGFSAPELLSGAAADPRSDVFSLGRMMQDVLARRPELLATDVGRKLRSMAAACVADDPSCRPSSARKVAEELGKPRRRLQPSALVLLAAVFVTIAMISTLIPREATAARGIRTVDIDGFRCIDIQPEYNATRNMIRSGENVPSGLVRIGGAPFLLGIEASHDPKASLLVCWSAGVGEGSGDAERELRIDAGRARATEARLVLGTLWGSPGQRLIDVEFISSDGSVHSVVLENGRDVRDYYRAEFVAKGMGQPGLELGGKAHLDVVRIAIPPELRGKELAALRIRDRGMRDVSRALLFAASLKLLED